MSANAQNSEELCPVCLETFSSRIRGRFLPCGNYHTVCEICLHQLVSINRTLGHFTCPVCRQLVQIPQAGVTGFQINRYIRLSNRQQPSFPSQLRTDRQRTLSAQVRFRAQQVEEDADLALQMQIQELTRLEASPRNYNQPVTRAPVPTALPGLTENQSRNTPIDRNHLQMNVVQILPPIQVPVQKCVITYADMTENLLRVAVDCVQEVIDCFLH